MPEGEAERYGKYKEGHGHQQNREVAAKGRDVGCAEGHQDRVGHAVNKVQDGRQ